MNERRNPRRFIEQSVVEKVELQFAGVEVKPHPQGGWTHAEPASPGSSSKLYRGNFPSKGLAVADLARRKREAIAALMRGVKAPDAAVTDEQMNLLQ